MFEHQNASHWSVCSVVFKGNGSLNYYVKRGFVEKVTAKLLSAHGYQGDAMNLPVADVDASAAYCVEKMGFTVVEQDTAPSEPPGSQAVKLIVLERDGVRIGLAENGGDPEEDGCAFHTDDVQALHDEFAGAELEKLGEIKDEMRGDGSRFRVFFVVAPDRLCFWFGERV